MTWARSGPLFAALLGASCAVDSAPPVTRLAAAPDAGSGHDARRGLFGRSNLIPSLGQQQARLSQALGHELATTLKQVDGVVDARVHLVLPGRQPVLAARRQASPPRASVLVKLGRDRALSREQVQALVAGAVRDMEPSAVRVVLVKVPAVAVRPSTPVLESVGPFEVAPGSRAALVASLCMGLFAIASLAALVIFLLLRRRAAPILPRDEGPDPDLESSLSLLTKTFRRGK